MFSNKWIVFHHPTNRFRWNRHHCRCRYRCHTRNFTLCQNIKAPPPKIEREREKDKCLFGGGELVLTIWRCWTGYNDVCFQNDNLIPYLARSLHLFLPLSICVCLHDSTMPEILRTLCTISNKFTYTHSKAHNNMECEREWNGTYQLNWCRAWWMARVSQYPLDANPNSDEERKALWAYACVCIMRWFLFEI